MGQGSRVWVKGAGYGSREPGMGQVILLQITAIKSALDRATIRLGIYTLIANI